MRYFLTRVKVEGFRGINNESEPLEVKFDKDKISPVFAVNGTGKSPRREQFKTVDNITAILLTYACFVGVVSIIIRP